MRYKKMRGKITLPSTHRDVVPFHDSPPSYFITIKIPAKPKIRIKIPKLLSKTMQKRFHGYNKDNVSSTIDRNDDNDDDDDDRKPRRTKTRRLLGLRKVGSIFNNVMKKVGFGLQEGESSRTIGEDGIDTGGGHDKGARAAMDTVPRSVVVIRRRESEGKFVTVSKRVLERGGAPRMVRSLRKFGSKKFDIKCLDLKHNYVTEKKEGLELCKKRILMGGKCKPLSISGALHYDKNGILLPEELPE